ncbi:sensor histidine kinase [Enterococcus sp. OL5]|uniref:sensor histidine kinase n=1 Tax=Enterococcus sp. OL5 TaxID=2590214 RepID=UPI00112EADB8|nr:histidine kinase [Enterococcus sp. OL5]TPR56877.1 HAMP domain-containing protein [Enterococcus sp. OL5]
MRKLYFMMSALVLSSFVISLSLFYYQSRQMINENMDEKASTITKNFQTFFDNTIETIDYSNYVISTNHDPIIDNLNHSPQTVEEQLSMDRKLSAYLTPMYSYQKYIRGIGVYGFGGKNRYTIGISRDSYFTKFYQPEEYNRMKLLEPLEESGNILIPLIRPILNNDDYIGNSVILLDFSMLIRDGLENLPENTRYTFTIKDKEIYSTVKSENLAKGYYEQSLISADGTIKANFYYPSTKLVENSSRRLALISLIYFVIFLSLITAFRWLSKRSLRNFSALQNAMKQVTHNNLDVSVAIDSEDDFGQMAKTFNSMTEELKELIQQNLDKEMEKKEVQYQLLQAQINPHFISNALNTITWMAEMQGTENIAELSNALTITINSMIRGNLSEISVVREIEYVQAYVEVEKFLHGDEFEVSYDIQDNTKNLMIPRFILQPIVENAIIHNLQVNNSYIDSVNIDISSEIVDGRLRVTIVDDGKGMPESTISQIINQENEKKEGLNHLGIHNVQNRIQLLYGDTYGLKFESVIGEYTRVEVTLPII